MLTTLLILGVSAVLFVQGRIRSDLVALCSLLCLIMFGILSPEQALSGFSNSIVVMMVGLFRGGRRHFPDGPGQDDGRQNHETGRQERVAPAGADHACYSRHRRICQQYGDGSADAAYSGEPGCGRRHPDEPSAHAHGICQQYGRHADADRHAPQPCRQQPASGGREWRGWAFLRSPPSALSAS